MAKHRDLEPDETAALQAFADAHGRKWRDELSMVYWYNARIWSGPVPGMGNVLHGIRNEFGPTWLWDVCKIKPAQGNPAKRKPVRAKLEPLERNPWLQANVKAPPYGGRR